MKIKKRYDEDDPQIENKILTTDANCIKSRPLAYEAKTFIATYFSDIISDYNLQK